MPAGSLIEARDLTVSFGPVDALRGCSLAVEPGERLAVMGPSGSGKSTLLHCLAGITTPISGEVWFEAERIDQLADARRSALRLRRMGVIFQFGDLVPELTLEENVMLPLLLTGTKRAAGRARARTLLDELGVGDVAAHRPGEVSGGEAQRAAVARALVHQPSVVLADEPTGSLDTVSAEVVLDALLTAADAHGTALVVVTHDHQVAAHLDRLAYLRDGAFVDQPVGAR